MKIRSGFVSNSSSSSFLIVFYDDKIKKCPTCGHTPVGMKTIRDDIDAKSNRNSDYDIISDDTDEIITKLEEYSLDIQGHAGEWVEKYRRALDRLHELKASGKKFEVLDFEISQHDKQPMIRGMVEGGAAEILLGDKEDL